MQSVDDAHKLLRLARLSRDTVNARYVTSQRAHREAQYRLNVCRDHLIMVGNELASVDLGIGRLRTLIRKSGFSLEYLDTLDPVDE